jgi:hypothetical protein
MFIQPKLPQEKISHNTCMPHKGEHTKPQFHILISSKVVQSFQGKHCCFVLSLNDRQKIRLVFDLQSEELYLNVYAQITSQFVA